MVAAIEGVEISYFTWKDNKEVNLLSKLAGKLSELKMKKFYGKKERRYEHRFPCHYKAL